MKWIMSAGGPLILMEDMLRKQWGGTDSVCVKSDLHSDYERGGEHNDYLRPLPLASGFALILGGGPIDTSVLMSPAGEIVVIQVECAEADDKVEDMFACGWGQSEFISQTEFEFHFSKIVVFDSAYPGDEEPEQLTFSLVPGHYRILTKRTAEQVSPQRGTCFITHQFERI